MKIWPQSLLGRTILLLLLLIGLSQLLWYGVVSHLEREPNVDRVAQRATELVQFARTALMSVPPGQRRAVIEALNGRDGIRIYPAVPGEVVAIPVEHPVLALLAQEMRDRLGPVTQVALGRHGIPGWWVSFEAGNTGYWLVMPRLKAESPVTAQWLWWGLPNLFIVLGGAWFFTWHVTRPLQLMSRAVEKIGHGEKIDLPANIGPRELGVVTKALSQMSSDLALLHQERTVMLAGISHDLRTPLTRLRLAVALLEKSLDREAHEAILQDIEDIDAIVGQFLSFAQSDEHESAIGADLNQLVETTCTRYGHAGKNVTLELEPLPPIALRPLSIRRLLSNLIDNALNHGHGRVIIRTRQKEGCITLSVLDRGPGISSDQTALALQPFTRLAAARGGSAGAGLGLAIVERIVQKHQGNIELLPREGGGLEARVILPILVNRDPESAIPGVP